MNIQGLPKLVGVLIAMVIIGVLIASNAITQEAGIPLITLMVGYLVGNGIAAKNDQPVQPILGKTHTTEEREPSNG